MLFRLRFVYVFSQDAAVTFHFNKKYGDPSKSIARKIYQELSNVLQFLGRNLLEFFIAQT